MRHLEDLPDDLIHHIFSELGFKDKIRSGLVCKHWDKLLKAGSGGGRHWVVPYDVNFLVTRSSSRWSIREPAGESMIAATKRCVTVYTALDSAPSIPSTCKCQSIMCIL